MSDLSDVRGLVQGQADGKRVAVVTARLDSQRVTVRLRRGGSRTVYGQAPVGATVMIKGEQLLGVIQGGRALRFKV